jgi:DNA-binding transcriptional regulator YiaG
MVSKGRQMRGERHWSAKITEVDVERIRDLARCGVSRKDVAGYIGISKYTVDKIDSRRRWSHI